MDAMVYLFLVPVVDLEARGLSKRKQSWQGIESEESKRFFDWGEYLTVERTKLPLLRNVASWLELSRVGENWDCLLITGDGLAMYWYEVQGSETDWGGRDFEGLLGALVGDVHRWALVFDIDDSIEDQFTSDLGGTIVRMRENLQAQPLPRGFIAFGSAGDIPS